jgi:hypothetical protein
MLTLNSFGLDFVQKAKARSIKTKRRGIDLKLNALLVIFFFYYSFENGIDIMIGKISF